MPFILVIALQQPIRISTGSKPTHLTAPYQKRRISHVRTRATLSGHGERRNPVTMEQFPPPSRQIEGQIEGQIGNIAYGVIYNSDDSGNHDYLCAVAMREFPNHPAEFTRLRIPPQSYSVFEHREHVSAIASTWKAVWEHGLAGAGFEPLDGPAFERYDEKFDGRTGLGGFEIWVPVKT